ncbi:MAG: aminoglycoside phosphotransferase family protein [Chloroflexota bacterium]|nr:aminoglycoside phosphotransferase family protein [Chloroflexota bacterium]
MTTEIIRRRHAAYQTPEQVIFDLVERATGHEALAREKIVRGYDSEVYLVHTRNNGDAVVRIRHHGGAPFADEAWAITQCRNAGVPVPDVLLVEMLPIDGHTREVMVQRRVPGRALSEIERDLTTEQRVEVWRQAGAALSAIHSVHAGGFYKRHSDGSWDFPNWDSVCKQSNVDRASEKLLLMQAGFSSVDVDLMLHILSIDCEQFPIEQPVLCHGDFLPGHLFVDDDLTLCGVIDFGEFQGGGPIGDFANLSMSCPDVDLVWLQPGYGNPKLFDDAFPMRLLVAKVGLQMGYLAHYIRQGNQQEAAPIATGLRESLRESAILLD